KPLARRGPLAKRTREPPPCEGPRCTRPSAILRALMASGNGPKRPGHGPTRRAPSTRPSRSPSRSKADPPTELEATRQELREALERQTAIGEILRAIAGSPTDIRPVLEAITASAI